MTNVEIASAVMTGLNKGADRWTKADDNLKIDLGADTTGFNRLSKVPMAIVNSLSGALIEHPVSGVNIALSSAWNADKAAEFGNAIAVCDEDITADDIEEAMDVWMFTVLTFTLAGASKMRTKSVDEQLIELMMN